MQTFLIRRLVQMAILMLAISALVFLIINFAPGGPFDTAVFGTAQVSPAQIDRLNELIGLNTPWYARYFIWLGNVHPGCRGSSRAVAYGHPATTLIFDRLGAPALLRR